MSIKAPAAVAFVQPLISRGEELKSADPIVAYFCIYYAVRQVLETKLHINDSTVAEFATTLLNTIEGLKASVPDQELLNDDDASRAHVLNFASTVFDRAERATQTHQVTKATGAGFAAAAIFLSLEGIWGEVEPETKEKIKFSKFQATRILKTIKEGGDPNELFTPVVEDEIDESAGSQEEIDAVQPTAERSSKDEATEALEEGQADQDADADAGIELPEPPRVDPQNDLTLPHAPKESLEQDLSLPPAPESKPEGNVSPPPPPPKECASNIASKESPDQSKAPQRPAQSNPAPNIPRNSTAPAPQPKRKPSASAPVAKSPQEIIALTKVTGTAQKHTKYAMSALNYDDITTAISELEQALRLLKLHQGEQ